MEIKYRVLYRKSLVISLTWTDFRWIWTIYQDRCPNHIETWAVACICELPLEIQMPLIGLYLVFKIFWCMDLLMVFVTVIWIIIQSMGKFQLSYLHCQNLYTCKIHKNFLSCSVSHCFLYHINRKNQHMQPARQQQFVWVSSTRVISNAELEDSVCSIFLHYFCNFIIFCFYTNHGELHVSLPECDMGTTDTTEWSSCDSICKINLSKC